MIDEVMEEVIRIYGELSDEAKQEAGITGKWYYYGTVPFRITVGAYGEYKIIDFYDGYLWHYNYASPESIQWKMIVKIEGIPDGRLPTKTIPAIYDNPIKIFRRPQFITIKPC